MQIIKKNYMLFMSLFSILFIILSFSIILSHLFISVILDRVYPVSGFQYLHSPLLNMVSQFKYNLFAMRFKPSNLLSATTFHSFFNSRCESLFFYLNTKPQISLNFLNRCFIIFIVPKSCKKNFSGRKQLFQAA